MKFGISVSGAGGEVDSCQDLARRAARYGQGYHSIGSTPAELALAGYTPADVSGYREAMQQVAEEILPALR